MMSMTSHGVTSDVVATDFEILANAAAVALSTRARAVFHDRPTSLDIGAVRLPERLPNPTSVRVSAPRSWASPGAVFAGLGNTSRFATQVARPPTFAFTVPRLHGLALPATAGAATRPTTMTVADTSKTTRS